MHWKYFLKIFVDKHKVSNKMVQKQEFGTSNRILKAQFCFPYESHVSRNISHWLEWKIFWKDKTGGYSFWCFSALSWHSTLQVLLHILVFTQHLIIQPWLKPIFFVQWKIFLLNEKNIASSYKYHILY